MSDESKDPRTERFGHIQGIAVAPARQRVEETWRDHMTVCYFCQTIAKGMGIKVFADAPVTDATPHPSSKASWLSYKTASMPTPDTPPVESSNKIIMTYDEWNQVCREIIHKMESGIDVVGIYNEWLQGEIDALKPPAGP